MQYNQRYKKIMKSRFVVQNLNIAVSMYILFTKLFVWHSSGEFVRMGKKYEQKEIECMARSNNYGFLCSFDIKSLFTNVPIDYA